MPVSLWIHTAELRTALKSRRSIVFPCGLRLHIVEAEKRPNRRKKNGHSCNVSPDIFLQHVFCLDKTKRVCDLLTSKSAANTCKNLQSHHALDYTDICTWQVRLIILSTLVEVRKRLWSWLNTEKSTQAYSTRWMGCTGVFPVVNQSSIFPLTPTLITSNLYPCLKQLTASTHSKTALNGNPKS